MIENIDYVRIILPTCNKRLLVQKTLESIKAQTYNEDNIEVIIVDFGSDIETYEWLLDYPLKHLAVYRKKDRVRESLDYYIANHLSALSVRLHNKYLVELQAGDVLYPDFISKCVNLMNKYKSEELGGIICEGVIELGNGSIKRQKRMFNNDRLLTRKDRLQYLTRGAAHRIIYFDRRKGLGPGASFDGWLFYDAHYWTYRFTRGNNENLLYLSEESGSIYSETTDCRNMLQKMIATYALILQFIRTYENSEVDSIGDKDQLMVYTNLAYQSLIMACECARQGYDKVAEDCCLFSKVIWLPIKDTISYEKVCNMLEDKKQYDWDHLIDEIIKEHEGAENYE